VRADATSWPFCWGTKWARVVRPCEEPTDGPHVPECGDGAACGCGPDASATAESRIFEGTGTGADGEGARLAAAAGFDSRAAARALQRLARGASGNAGLMEYFSSHPPIAERVRKLERGLLN